MPQFAESADVAAPMEKAFDYVTDQTRIAEWNEHVESVRRGSRTFDLTFEVREHDRPRRHVVTGTVFGVQTTMTFDFAALGAATRVTMTGDVSGKGWRALLAPVVAREMRKSVVAALDELTRRLAT